MSRPWSPAAPRRMFALLAAAGLVLGTTACGSGADPGSSAGGKVTITVTGQPPTSQPFERGVFDADVKEFEAAHPNVKTEV